MDAARLPVVTILAAVLALPAPALAKHKHKRHRHAAAPPALAAPNPPAAIGACPDADLAPAPDDLDRVQAATLCLVKQERAKVGLGALDDQPQAGRAARTPSSSASGPRMGGWLSVLLSVQHERPDPIRSPGPRAPPARHRAGLRGDARASHVAARRGDVR